MFVRFVYQCCTGMRLAERQYCRTKSMPWPEAECTSRCLQESSWLSRQTTRRIQVDRRSTQQCPKGYSSLQQTIILSVTDERQSIGHGKTYQLAQQRTQFQSNSSQRNKLLGL